MSNRWGDTKRDRDALDRHIIGSEAARDLGRERREMTVDQLRQMDEHHAHEVMDDRLRWEHGTLSTGTMKRVAADVLADLWWDSYRGGSTEAQRRKRFTEQVANALYIATGDTFTVS